MRPRILLVNPPIHDFSAYDFWLKPYGLLQVAGRLRGRADMALFDHLDRESPLVPAGRDLRSDEWGRGEFFFEEIVKPAPLAQVPRRFKRFGIPRQAFRGFLEEHGPFDFALLQTGMTYWYLGVREVIEDIRALAPQARIVLGGVYATLCPAHARGLGADLVVEGADLQPLWQILGLAPDLAQPPFWESCASLAAGVLRLTDGCPCRCTYCAVPRVYGGFKPRDRDQALTELEALAARGVRNVAFYDDALLCDAKRVLDPFLQMVLRRGMRINFHTPNALNARFITPDLATLMVQAGFKTFYLGFESGSAEWQRETGGKVSDKDFADAVEHLRRAGAPAGSITAYILCGHPDSDRQQVEAAMRRAHGLGVRVMLAEFSPIPCTPDGDACRRWADLGEPLWHNKTAFAIAILGEAEVQRLKQLARDLNGALAG